MTVNSTKQANTPPNVCALTNPINVIISRNTILRRIFIPPIL